MMATLADLLPLVPGATLVGAGATPIARVHSDTRSLQSGDLFVALRGERFDAHDFLAQARAAGAAAALAERGLADAGLAGLQVPDTQKALEALAAGWRRRFTLPLVAVAGSNGKTTVTQMLAAVLRAWQGDAALATEGNLNNHIGVPLTLLRLRAAHRCAVVELGMNHPGEIALLAGIARPTVAIVNNAQREHQEFMQSVAAVAHENGGAIAALPADGTAVFPNDDAHAGVWRAIAGARRTLTFAANGVADVTGHATWQAGGWNLKLYTPQGEPRVLLQIAGAHNVKNALAATAAALAAGVPLEAVVRGLEAFRPVPGRSVVRTLQRGGRGVTLVDDTYNANPDSVRAAIDLLAALPGPRWLVLGDMGEVGDRGPEFHAEVGAYARERGIESVWLAGTLTAHAAGDRHFAAVPELLATLGEAPAFASVLVKGSRFMRMERVVAALAGDGSGAGGTHAH
jgi:UDP-N-acetylmuramoyl-tripeptide--D-alanyl-D-alanine ligase